jgi:para-aminobenzoate synthetase/4-amino-4-deoxychorismate lyase
MPVVVLYSPEQSSWVRYDRPQAVFVAHNHDEVPQLIDHLETEVERQGLHAAGFLAYEAGGAFDPAMPRPSCAPFPLAWFGLFEPPRPITLHTPATDPDYGPRWVPELDAAAHARALEQIRRHLAAGETYQVNFTHRLRARFGADPWPYFLRLAAHQPSPHAAFVDCGDFAICCASPEMFFHRQGPEVWSRPMKGTAPRGRWAAEDEAAASSLVRSEKERAENVMIVDMVRNDLGRVCQPGSVHVPELFRAERYPTLWQLTSLVCGLSDQPTARVLAALFPAASITGAPKVRTMRIIGELETSPRRIYTGTIGVMTPGRGARFNVAIRTVLVDKRSGTAEYGVGGGIVWDSDSAAEYRETLLKARVLEASPPEFELLETMRWSREGGIFLIDEHLRRLGESAGYFGFALDLAALREALDRETASAPEEAGVLRLRLSKDGVWAVERRPLPPSGPCRVALAAVPVDSRDTFLFHKTTRRGVYVAARAGRPGVDDVLLWNERGEVTEATIASVVVEMDGALLTPPVDCGLLPGTFRRHLLDGGQVREGIVRVADLPRCDRIWLVSAVRGWREATLVER